MKKRLIFFMSFTALLLGALLTRLVFIQLIDTEKYASVTDIQQRIRLDGTDQRGVIYDRNMEPLTSGTEEYVYIIQKEKMDVRVERIMDSLDGRKVVNQNDKYEVYSSEAFSKADAFVLRRDYEAFMLKAERRYEKDQPAAHLIGYINEIDGRGACGLEKDFDKALTKKEKKIYASADARGKIIPGRGVTAEEKRVDSGIITTLHKEMQKRAEEIMEECGYNGALVVTDVESGELLASASVPIYHPYDVKRYLESEKGELVNNATQSLYAPGSIFKIIVAATALEKGIVTPETKFVCKGYEVINGVKIKCSNEQGHGEITFRNGFAKSCNSVFIQIGGRLGGEEILRMARAFGLGETAIPNLSGESKGMVSQVSDTAGAGIGNLSIGQGKLLVTPMQISRVTGIIAEGGIDKGITLVKGTTCDGVVQKLGVPKPRQVISQQTAETIASFMEEVVKSGTANNLVVKAAPENAAPSSEKIIKAAGKTGSAEAVTNGTELVHGWFTGFLPVDNPKYAITVLVENGGSGRGAAIPLFQEMAEAIYKINSKDK